MKLSTFLILALCVSLILAKNTESSQVPKSSIHKSSAKSVVGHTKTGHIESKKRLSTSKSSKADKPGWWNLFVENMFVCLIWYPKNNQLNCFYSNFKYSFKLIQIIIQ